MEDSNKKVSAAESREHSFTDSVIDFMDRVDAVLDIDIKPDSEVTVPLKEYNSLVEEHAKLDMIRRFCIHSKYVSIDDVRLIAGGCDGESDDAK